MKKYLLLILLASTALISGCSTDLTSDRATTSLLTSSNRFRLQGYPVKFDSDGTFKVETVNEPPYKGTWRLGSYKKVDEWTERKITMSFQTFGSLTDGEAGCGRVLEGTIMKILSNYYIRFPKEATGGTTVDSDGTIGTDSGNYYQIQL